MIRLLVDSDGNSDVDDAATWAYLHGKRMDGVLDIIGWVTPSRCQWVAPAMDRFARWHGAPPVPIGRWDGPDYPDITTINSCTASWWTGRSSFAPEVAAAYPGGLEPDGVPHSTRVYRDVLAAADDGQVTVLVIGYHTALHDFLQSPADWEGDGLPSGIDLANAKVAEFVVGGSKEGPGQPNFNWTQAPDHTRWILANVGLGLTVDVPWIVSPNNNGGANKATQAPHQPEGQILRHAMRSFFDTNELFEAGCGASDPTTAVMLTHRAWFTPVRGTYGWDPNGTSWPGRDDGRETWTPDPTGPHTRMEKAVADSLVTTEFDANIWHPQQDPPPAGQCSDWVHASDGHDPHDLECGPWTDWTPATDTEPGRIVVELPISWDVRTPTSTDLDLSWHVRTPVHTTLPISWDVRSDDTTPTDGIDLTIMLGAPQLAPRAQLGQPAPAPLVRAGPPADTRQAHIHPPSAPRRVLVGPPTI